LGTDFEKDASSYNQKSVARILDRLSTELGPSKLDYLINRLDYIGGGNDIKEILTEIAPYFMMNIFLSQTMDNSRNDVYSRLQKPNVYNGDIESWGRAQGAVIEYGIDDNSPMKFRNVVSGMIFGIEKYNGASDMTLGVVGRYNTNSMVQGPSDATTYLYNLSGYAGFYRGDTDVKVLLGGGINTNETHRSIEFLGKRANAVFDSYTGMFDIEVGHSLDYLLEGYIVRPFVGAYATTLIIPEIKEEEAEVLSIRYNPNTFIRSAFRGGLGLYGGDDVFMWNISATVDYVFRGQYAELEGRFQQDSEDSFKFRSVDIGPFLYGLLLNVNCNVSDRIGLFVGLTYSAATRYEFYSGSAGIRYFL
jgi:hypothetical protein